MDNIPEGYDENGVRGGNGDWRDYLITETEDDIDVIIEDNCPECGSPMVWRNEYDFLVCDTCGYEEVPEDKMGVCDNCGSDTPEELLTDGLCPDCVNFN